MSYDTTAATTYANNKRSRIKQEAQTASLRYSTMNEACPYPFGTDEWNLFDIFFTAARQEQEDAIQITASQSIQASLDAGTDAYLQTR